MANIEQTPDDRALVVSCPVDDIAALVAVLGQSPVALLPVGGPGDLGQAVGVTTVLLIEIGPEGARPAVRWRASVADATPVTDPAALLPATWVVRHPDAYLDSRKSPATAEPGTDTWVDTCDDEENDEERAVQVFLPLTGLEQLPREGWLFANELVAKQNREGRTYAPRVPALVTLPSD